MTELYNGHYGSWTEPRNYTKPSGEVYRTAIYGGDRTGEICSVNVKHPHAAANAQLIHAAPYLLVATALIESGMIRHRVQKDFDLAPFLRLAGVAQAMARGHEGAEAVFEEAVRDAETALGNAVGFEP